MNKKIQKTALLVTLIFGMFSFTLVNTTKQAYKCVVQLKNYDGEGAYVIVSLVNPDGTYKKTLSILGDDEEWYEDLKTWWAFNETAQENIDAIAGESIIGGERKQISFKLASSLINKGYKIRFESAVEDQKYYEKDVEIDFSSANFNKKIKGNGYIRYVNIVQK